MMNVESLENSKIKLRDYQKKALEFADSDRFILNMAVGTGKTFTALGLAQAQNLKQLLVICPASLLHQWKKNCEAFGFDSVLVYEGTPAKRRSLEVSKFKVVIMSYQIFKNDYDRLIKEFSDSLTVILDECQNIKSIRSKNHKFIKRFITRFKNCKLIGLSGTLISKPDDAYGLCKVFNPSAYKSKAEFEFRHIAEKDFWGNAVRYKDLNVLNDNLLRNAYTVTDEVLDLDEPVIIKIPYTLTTKHLKLYKKVLNDRLIELEDDEVLDFTNVNRLFHVAQELVIDPDNIVPDCKIKPQIGNIIKDILNQIPESEKVLFFTQHISVTRYVTNLLGDKAVSYYGQQKKEEKNEAIEKFKGDVPYLVANIQAAGTGLDGLQDVCNHMVFIQLPLVPANFDQCIGRLRRSGQTKPVKVFITYAQKTIQAKLLKALENKELTIKKMSKDLVKSYLSV